MPHGFTFCIQKVHLRPTKYHLRYNLDHVAGQANKECIDLFHVFGDLAIYDKTKKVLLFTDEQIFPEIKAGG